MFSANSTNRSKKPANYGSPPTINWKSIAANGSKNGAVALKSTNNPKLCPACCLTALIFAVYLWPLAAISQEPSLDSRVKAATAVLTELDNRAEGCLVSLQTTTPGNLNEACGAFLEAIDGEILANYLNHCEALKSWREEFIISSDITVNNTEEKLQRLVGIELACGENALQKRTQYVFSAFNQIRQSETAIRSSSILGRSMSELEFESNLNQYQMMLQNSIQQQRRRLDAENQKLQNDIEKELIRQQISNPSGAFQHRSNNQ